MSSAAIDFLAPPPPLSSGHAAISPPSRLHNTPHDELPGLSTSEHVQYKPGSTSPLTETQTLHYTTYVTVLSAHNGEEVEVPISVSHLSTFPK